MAIYDFVKDAIGIAQQADNIDLIKKLLDIGQMAQDLQNENAALKKKIDELTKSRQFEQDIVRHKEPYYTLKSDGEESAIYYCSTCYGKENKKIQMMPLNDSELWCPACRTKLYINGIKRRQSVYY